MDARWLWGLQLAATSAVHVGAALVAGAIASLWLLPVRSAWAQGRARALRGVALAATGGLLAATVLLLWTQAATMVDQPLLAAASLIPRVMMHTHLGHAWLAGAAALAALWCSGFAGRRWPARQRGFLAVASAAGLVFAASRSASGHAGASGWVLPAVADWVHLLCASVWAGTLMLAAAVVCRAPLPAATATHRDCARFVARLSLVATWALTGALVTGAVSAWRALGGSPAALTASGYGQILLVKLALVAAAVALGAHKRWAVLPRLLAGLQANASPPGDAARAFTRVLAVESLVLLAVLGMAAALGTSAPPAQR